MIAGEKSKEYKINIECHNRVKGKICNSKMEFVEEWNSPTGKKYKHFKCTKCKTTLTITIKWDDY